MSSQKYLFMESSVLAIGVHNQPEMVVTAENGHLRSLRVDSTIRVCSSQESGLLLAFECHATGRAAVC